MEDDGDDSWEDENSSSVSSEDESCAVDSDTLQRNLSFQSKKYNCSYRSVRKILKVRHMMKVLLILGS